MSIYDYMEGYDRSFDENEFDIRLWDYIQEEGLSDTEELEHFLRDYGIDTVHQFFKIVRRKKEMKQI